MGDTFDIVVVGAGKSSLSSPQSLAEKSTEISPRQAGTASPPRKLLRK
jgi:hypothetical protein